MASGVQRKEALKCVERNSRQDVKSACQKGGGMDEIRQLLSRRESASEAHAVLYGGGGDKKCVHLSALAVRTTRDRDTSQPRK